MALNGGRDLTVNYRGSVAGLKGPTAAARTAVGSVAKAAEDSSKRSSRAMGALKTVGRGVGRVVKTTAVGAGIAIGGIAATAIAKGFTRLTAIENAQAKLKGLGYSAKSVTTIMGNALKSVKGTAFGLGDAATVAAQAVAAGIKPGKQLQATLDTVANTAAASGSSLGEMGSIFTKVAASNKAYNGSLQQLSDRGLPIYQALAKQLHTTTDGVFKLASKGQISFKQFQAAATAASGTVAKEMGKTTTGSLDNVGAALGRLGAAVEGGLFAHAPAIFGNLITVVDNLTTAVKPLADAIGDRLGKALVSVTGKLAKVDFAKITKGVSTFLAKLDFSSVSGFVKSLGGTGSAFSGIGRSIQTLMPAVKSFAAQLPKIGAAGAKVGAAGLKMLTSALSFLADHVDTIIKFMPAIVAGFIAWRVASQATASATLAMNAANLAALPAQITRNGLRLAAAVIERQNLAATAASTAATEAQTAVENVGMLTRIRSTAALVASTVATKAAAVASKVFAAGQWLVNAALTANPIGIVVMALAALVAGLIYAYKHSETFRKIVQGAWKGIKKVVSAVAKWFTGTLWPGIKRVWNAITNVNTQLRSTMSKVWRGIKDTIGTVLATIRSTSSRIWNGIKSTVSGVWNSIKSAVSRAINAVRSTINRVLSAIRSVNSSIWNGIRSTISRVWSSIRSSVSGAIGRVRAAVSSGLNRVVSTVRGLPGRVVSIIRGMGSQMYSAGSHLISMLASGITHALGMAVGAARGIANKIKGLFGGSPVEYGPLLGWNNGGVGRNLGGMLAKGLRDSRGEVGRAATDLARTASVDAHAGLGLSMPQLGRPVPRPTPPAPPAQGIDEARLASALARALDGLRVDLANGQLYVEDIVAGAAKDAEAVF